MCSDVVCAVKQRFTGKANAEIWVKLTFASLFFYSPPKHPQYMTLTDLVYVFANLRVIGSRIFCMPKLERVFLDKTWAVVFLVQG